jgi:hypothetical protein
MLLLKSNTQRWRPEMDNFPDNWDNYTERCQRCGEHWHHAEGHDCDEPEPEVEVFDILARTTPKARKPHKCDACGGRIETGAVYLRGLAADLIDNSVFTVKICLSCTRPYEQQ